MQKFMSCHTMPAGALKREQVNQLAAAAQGDTVVRPYRSFLNLSQGKVCCIMEAAEPGGVGRLVSEDADALRLHHAGRT